MTLSNFGTILSNIIQYIIINIIQYLSLYGYINRPRYDFCPFACSSVFLSVRTSVFNSETGRRGNAKLV